MPGRLDSSLASAKFEQIPLFYSRGLAAPLRGIAPISTLERFVVYCSCEQIISAAPGGAAQRARGIAQLEAVTFVVYCSCGRLFWPRPRARRRGHGELLKLYSRLLIVRRTDQQHRFVWAAPDNPSPGPSRAGRPTTESETCQQTVT